MTLFWHGHFTSKDGGMAGRFAVQPEPVVPAKRAGQFSDADPGRLARPGDAASYLNGNQNYKAHPNENYGRELMELFTCGIGHYTEDDVKAAARAFSGWNLRGGEFDFNPNQHDNDPKTFLGKTGNWNGDDIVDILVAHPATAQRLCTQLFTYFAYPNPEPEVIDALVQTYYSSGYDVRAILSQMFHSRAFYSDKARFAVIKSPAQYVVGTVKMLGLDKAVELILSDITPANDMAANPAARPRPPVPASRAGADRACRDAAAGERPQAGRSGRAAACHALHGPGSARPADRQRLGRRRGLDQHVYAAGPDQLRQHGLALAPDVRRPDRRG